MNNLAEILSHLDDLYVSLSPKNVLMIGNIHSALIEYFYKKDVSILNYGLNNFGSISIPQTLEIVILDRSVLDWELSLLANLLNTVCPTAESIVINLFSEEPEDSVQVMGQFGSLLTEHNYFRDLENYSLYSPFVVFRKQSDVSKAIAKYEESLSLLKLENQRKTEMLVELGEQEVQQYTEFNIKLEASLQKTQELSRINREAFKRNQDLWQKNEELNQKIEQLAFMINAFWSSRTGKLIQATSSFRRLAIPPGSRRDRILLEFFSIFRILTKERSSRIRGNETSENQEHGKKGAEQLINEQVEGKLLTIPPIESAPPLRAHTEEVSIIVCVHNAFEDVKRCMESIRLSTTSPYEIVIVDDGSEKDTAGFLKAFSESFSIKLVRNETARGYTYAANQGIQASSGEFVVLLNSDTIVTDGWLDRMVSCAQVSEKTGVVGPLSNTASYQSIPEYANSGDWAMNPLPENISVQDMGRMVAENSGRLYPEMPLLNGFCLLVRRRLIDEIGFFDEENFGAGYGEEDDFNLRARAAGWVLRLADDTYIFHAQSKSYSNEKRTQLSARAGKILKEKHGLEIVQKSVNFMEHNRVLEGIRSRSKVLCEREMTLRMGKQKFLGKRVLFVLPITRPGGGGNVVLYEANAMRKMGVEVSIFNLKEYKDSFQQSYPNLAIPMIFGDIEDLSMIAANFDAVISTAHYSVQWLEKIPSTTQIILGYYVQGFEALMYEPNTPGYQQAIDSYTLIPRMKCFTKTDWTRRMVLENTGRSCKVVGVSLDLDLMRPRPNNLLEWPQRPIRIGAMIRPDSPYREPEKTMLLLKKAVNTFHSQVEAVLFGTTKDDPEFQKLSHDFNWNLYGILTQKQTANLLNEVDIFVDYSSHQAMGLTALEAMANGCAVIVPIEGGAVSFAEDHINSLVVDSGSFENVWNALRELIEKHELRKKLQQNALYTVGKYYPEKSALNILGVLFEDPSFVKEAE